MSQNIVVYPDRLNPLEGIMQVVHKFYPIGLEVRNEQHEGFLDLQKIVDQKVNSVRSNTLPENLVFIENQIRKSFLDRPLYFEFHRSFPSYSIVIELCSDDYHSVKKTIYLHLKISLLGNFYTSFAEIRTEHNDIVHQNHAVTSSVLAKKSVKNDYAAGSLSVIDKLMTEFFPTYVPFDHYLAFHYKVEYGVPYSEDFDEPRRRYPIYSYIFEKEPYINYQLVF